MSQGSRRETLRQQIDENLRRVYQEKIEEGIPDRFSTLLQQLRRQDGPDERDGDNGDRADAGRPPRSGAPEAAS